MDKGESCIILPNNSYYYFKVSSIMYIYRIMPSIVSLDSIKGLSDQQLCKALWDEITSS